MQVIIRRVRQKDLPKIYTLGKTIEELKPSIRERFHERDELEEWFKNPKDNIFLAAVLKNRVVGFLYAKIISSHWCMLDNIGVEKNYRGQGIGTSLLESLYEILKKRNVDYLQAFVGMEGEKARKFYQGKKFKEGKSFIWVEKNL